RGPTPRRWPRRASRPPSRRRARARRRGGAARRGRRSRRGGARARRRRACGGRARRGARRPRRRARRPGEDGGIGEEGARLGGGERLVRRTAPGEVEVGVVARQERERGLVAGTEAADRYGHAEKDEPPARAQRVGGSQKIIPAASYSPTES